MSTLKVNKIRDTSGSADAITLDPSGGAVLAGVTTISTARITTGITTSIQVGGGVTISESGIEASGIGITCANINGTQIGGRRNIIINGAMNIAQRGTQSSTSEGYVIDRMNFLYNGTDEAPTYSQQSISSSDTGPYELGFTKYLRIQNGNQTSGGGSADYILFRQSLEAQNIANSGWRSQSPTSFMTLSFWVKSSVAQTFYGNIMSVDGTQRNFPFSLGSLSANTWTKVIQRIPGNTSPTVDIDNDNGTGINIDIWPYAGANYTDSGTAVDTWTTFVSGTRLPVNTATWYTTNDATFDVTGMQLEVGSQATPFEFRSFGEELALCRRYYYDYIYKETSGGNQYGTTNANRSLGIVQGWAATEVDHPVKFPTPMRAIPSLIQSTGSNYFQIEGGGETSTFVDGNWTLQFGTVNGCNIYATPDNNVTSGYCYHGVARNTSAQISFDAEL